MSVRILLAIPTRDGVVISKFAQSLMEAAREPWCYGVLWVEHESDIVRARGRAVAEFLETDADALLMLDDDMAWSVAGVRALLEVPRGRCVVGAVYSKRSSAGGLVYLGPLGVEHEMVRDAVEVPGVGAGMLLIWREALDGALGLPDVKWHGCHRPWPGVFRQVELPDGEYLSEDYAFCHRVRESGGRVWMHRMVRPGHVGRKEFEV